MIMRGAIRRIFSHPEPLHEESGFLDESDNAWEDRNSKHAPFVMKQFSRKNEILLTEAGVLESTELFKFSFL